MKHRSDIKHIRTESSWVNKYTICVLQKNRYFFQSKHISSRNTFIIILKLWNQALIFGLWKHNLRFRIIIIRYRACCHLADTPMKHLINRTVASYDATRSYTSSSSRVKKIINIFANTIIVDNDICEEFMQRYFVIGLNFHDWMYNF